MPPARLVFALPGLLAVSAAPGAPQAARGADGPVTPGGRAAGPAAPHLAPHLARLVAAAGVPCVEPEGTATALARVYGIGKQQDWPLAAIRLSALGRDPGTDYWLAADPVTLIAGRDDLRLAGVVGDLAAEQAAALIAALNAHFAADALVFCAPRPGAWFVRTPAGAALVTCPLATAAGRSLRDLQPSGADAGTWRRWQNEIQMLLHEHPVNQARERQGLPPANSVWFWGGGTLAPPGAATIVTYAGGGSLAPAGTAATVTPAGGEIAAALAAHRGAPAQALPATLAAVLANGPTDGREPATAVIALDPPLGLAAVDRDWAAPAWGALVRGAIESVTLIADGDGRAAVWTARRPGMGRRLASRLRSPDLRALLAAAGVAPGGGT